MLKLEREEAMSETGSSDVFVLSNEMRKILEVRLEHWTISERFFACREYERFFILALHFRKKLWLPVSKEIDQIWHYCILSTRDYFDTCSRLGFEYLHHEPRIASTFSIPLEENSRHGLEWMLSYTRNFGKYEDEAVRYWPVAGNLCSKAGWTLADLNTKLEMLLKGSAGT